MRIIAVGCIAATLFLTAAQLWAADYFVAPAGADDAADGSVARPFGTIDKALLLAKPGDRVLLRSGEYRLTETLRFPRAGEPGRPIILAAHENEYVALLGSVRLTQWQPHQGKIWKCKTPPKPIEGLYEDAERLVHPRERGKRENPSVAAIQAPGRWTAQDGWIYLWTREGDSPAHHRIEASQQGVINLDRPWLRVEKLHVFFGQPTGLVISADRCEAVDCEVAHVSNSVDNAYGAYFTGCSNSALRRCRIHDSYYWGDHGSNSHVVSCIDCGDDGPNFIEGCEIFNGGLGVGTKSAARELTIVNSHIQDVLRGVTFSGERSSGPGAGKTDRGHYLVWRNRINDCAVGVYLAVGRSHDNRIAGNLFERCDSGARLRKYRGVPEKPLIVNNVFRDCREAILVTAEREGRETLSQFGAGGLRSHHNLFFNNGVDWRNPLSWSANLDRSFAEIRSFGNFGWEAGSIGGDPLLDRWGRAEAGSPTIGAGAPLELPAYVEKPERWHIGLGPWGSRERRPEPGLTLSIAGSQTAVGPGEAVKLRAALKNEFASQEVELAGDCLVTLHFRYTGGWYFDRQEIWRTRVSVSPRKLRPGESLELSALDGWKNPVNGRLGEPFHLRADDQYWKPGCRLRATARFVRDNEPTAEAVQRLEPLLRSTEVQRITFN